MAKQALPGSRLNMFGMDPWDVVVIGIDTDDGPEHPLAEDLERLKAPLDEPFVLDIMDQGVLEPVIVRKNGDRAEVNVGRLRVLHLREANKRLKAKGRQEWKLPVIVRRSSDKEALGVTASENSNRRGYSPMQNAKLLNRLLNGGYSLDDAAVKLGVQPNTARNWAALLECHKDVQRAVEAGKIGATAASQLAKLPRAEQLELLPQLLAEGAGAVSVERTRVAMKQRQGAEANLTPSKGDIKRVLKRAAEYDHNGGLHPEFVRALRWAAGEIATNTVAGLAKLVKK